MLNNDTLDKIKFSVAPPFQACTWTGYTNDNKWDGVVYHPIGQKSVPPTEQIMDPNFKKMVLPITYLDSQGRNAEEVSKRLKIVSLGDIVRAIRTDEKTRKVCEFLRHPANTKPMQTHVKMSMLYRMYPAVFDLNAENKFKFLNSNVAEYQGVLCFDVDNLSSLELAVMKDEIQADPYTLVGFVSPRGNGYKWMVRVPAIGANHPYYYDALLIYYNVKFDGTRQFDTSCRNINRTIFASHDPGCYVNKDALIWHEKKMPDPPVARRTDFPESTGAEKFAAAVDRVQRGARKSGQTTPLFFVDGYKHTFLTALTGMCKGMGIEEQEFKYLAGSYIIDRPAMETVDMIYRRK